MKMCCLLSLMLAKRKSQRKYIRRHHLPSVDDTIQSKTNRASCTKGREELTGTMMLTSPLVVYPAAVMATTMAASMFVWFRKPGVLLRLLFRMALYKAGLKIHYVMAGKYRFCYAERGKPQPGKTSMLLVHGFSASKDMWVTIVQRLPQDLHIIVVDLPGHGDTTVPSGEDDLTPHALAACLHDFLEAINMPKPFHLVGTSLGGAIALFYSATYPDDIARLSAICPAMKTPETTEFLKEVEAGHCRLIPNTADEMKYMMDSCMYHKPKIHRQIVQGILQIRKPRNAFFTRLFDVISDMGNHELLMKITSSITMPTQVIWGRQDELIHVSGAELLKEHLPNLERVDILEDCGHSVNMDRPNSVVKNLLDFRGELPEEFKKKE